jgi:hypothetical protein
MRQLGWLTLARHGHADRLTRTAVDGKDLGADDELDAFSLKQPLQLFANLAILAAQHLRAGLDYCHPAAEPAIGLRHLEAELLLALLAHCAQVGAKGGFGDRLGVVLVVLLALHDGLHIDRCNDARLVA